jgi:methanogenic corrinoid protein MtbC1
MSSDPANALRRHADRYEAAARLGDMAGVRGAVDAALATGASVQEVHAFVIAPAMAEIGRLWERGTIGVAAEQVATAITLEEISRLYGLAPAPSLFREEILLSAIEGEAHVLGLRMSADLLAGGGFRIRYLGAGVRRATLLEAAASSEPAAVVLSIKRLELADELRESVSALRDVCAAKLIVAGDGVPADLRGSEVAIYVPGLDGIVAAVEAALSSR